MGLSVGWLLVKHTQNAKNKPVINSADTESRKTLSQELSIFEHTVISSNKFSLFDHV